MSEIEVKALLVELQDERKKNALLQRELTSVKKEHTDQGQYIAQQMLYLEELHKTKDKFFSIIAHDLKSPLNALKSFLSLLIQHSEKVSKEQIKEMGIDLNSSLDNTIQLTDNLIMWAKIQMKMDVFQPRETMLTEVLENSIAVYADVAAKKGVDFHFSMEENTLLFIDKYQIAFSVRNLIDNAVKFTPSGGRVEVTCRLHSPEEIVIVIADNGVGISESFQQKLFKLAGLSGKRGTAGEKGTGIGLLLSYEFVKLNNCRLLFTSEAAKGTTFQMFLNRLTQ